MKKEKFILTILIFIGIITRLAFLEKLPPALYQDETAIGYNAYSILKTGKDEWGKAFPIYFKSFGDFKLPFYIYTVAFFEKLFGLTEKAIRLPSAIAGILTIIFLFLTVKHLTKNLFLAFTTSLILALNPQHIFFSRAGFEVNLSLTLIISGVYFFLKFTTSEKTINLLISSLLFTTATYTYNVSRLISPLLFLFLLFLFKEKILKFNKVKLFIIFLLNFILLLPFIKVFFSPLGTQTAKGEVIFSSPYVLAENVMFRTYLLDNLHPLFVKIFFNKYLFFLYKYIQNLLSIINFKFFFVRGSSHPNQGIGNIGFMHLYQAPFFLLGFYYALKKRKLLPNKIFLGWFIISYLTLALSRQVPHATRGFFLIIPLIYFSSLGWIKFLKTTQKLNSNYKRIIYGSTLAFLLYTLLNFSLSYIVIFPKEKAKAWGVAQKELALYLKNKIDKYQKIIIDKKTPISYTTLAFYLKLDPETFQKTVKYEKSGDLYYAKKFYKFEIKEIDINQDLKPGNLLILDGLSTPPQDLIIKKIRLPKRHIALSLQDNIVQWPEEKVEFVLIEAQN